MHADRHDYEGLRKQIELLYRNEEKQGDSYWNVMLLRQRRHLDRCRQTGVQTDGHTMQAVKHIKQADGHANTGIFMQMNRFIRYR
jgi:hypothetical protein